MGAVAMDLAQQQIAAKLLELRPKFISQITQRLERLEGLRDRFEMDPDDGSIREELVQGAHKIAGVAGMFGEADLGEIARYAEIAMAQQTEDALDLFDDLLGEMALIVAA